MIAAPTFSQIKAQVAGIRQKSPDARVIGIHAQGRWSGERQNYDGEQLYLIEQCDSPLALRIALRQHPPAPAIQVLLTPLQENDLEADIRLRLAKQRLFVIDQWQILKSLFRASNIDSRLLKHRWMAESLMDWMPAHRYSPVLGGFLDAEIVWPLVLEYGMGLVTERPDLPTILQWSTDPEAVDRYQRATPDFRGATCEWLISWAGPTVAPILDCVYHCQQPDALPLGLAAEVIYHTDTENRLEKAIGKLEERFFAGQSNSPATLRLWSKAARQALHQIQDPAQKQKLIHRSDEILFEIGAQDYAYLSTISEQGLNQQLGNLSNNLLLLVKKPTATALAKVQQSYQVIKHHQQIINNTHPRRLTRLEMALRLSQWLVHANTSKQAPKDLAAAITYHLQEGGFLDWARLTLRLAEPHPDLSNAYAHLFAAVTTFREAQSSQFAKLLQDWTAIGTSRSSIIPVEQILETVVAELDEKIPILVIVIDGMSIAVAYELLTDLKNQPWRLLRPQQQNLAIRPGLAALPSITEISRTSLLCGQLQQGQASQEKQGFAQHPALLKRCKRGAPPLLFHKASLQSMHAPLLTEDVSNAIESSKNMVVGVVINAVDDLLSKGDQVDTQWTFEQIKILLPLLQAASQAKRLVILTSDHGHVLHTNAVYQSAQGGERWRMDDGHPTGQELLLKGERVIVPDSASASQILIVPWTEQVRYCSTKKNGYHGGVNPQEMIVPIAVIAPTGINPTGWQEDMIQHPSFWELISATANQTSAVAQAQPPTEYADFGPLFSSVT